MPRQAESLFIAQPMAANDAARTSRLRHGGTIGQQPRRRSSSDRPVPVAARHSSPSHDCKPCNGVSRLHAPAYGLRRYASRLNRLGVALLILSPCDGLMLPVGDLRTKCTPIWPYRGYASLASLCAAGQMEAIRVAIVIGFDNNGSTEYGTYA